MQSSYSVSADLAVPQVSNVSRPEGQPHSQQTSQQGSVHGLDPHFSVDIPNAAGDPPMVSLPRVPMSPEESQFIASVFRYHQFGNENALAYIHHNKFILPASSPSTDDCVVCLEPMLPGEEVGKLRCAHSFHADCLSRWLSSRLTSGFPARCPNCSDVVLNPLLPPKPPDGGMQPMHAAERRRAIEPLPEPVIFCGREVGWRTRKILALSLLFGFITIISCAMFGLKMLI